MNKNGTLKKFTGVGINSVPPIEFTSASTMLWEQFENLARKAIENELGCILNGGKVIINGKTKRFDLLNTDLRIVGDVKHYKMTSGGNNPSAKFSTLNEYAWLMQKLEQYEKHTWQKLFVIGEDMDVVKTYVSTYGAWLDDIEIYHCSAKGILSKIR